MPEKPSTQKITDVRFTRGVARYKPTVWQRIKRFVRELFARKVDFPSKA